MKPCHTCGQELTWQKEKMTSMTLLDDLNYKLKETEAALAALAGHIAHSDVRLPRELLWKLENAHVQLQAILSTPKGE